MSNTLRTIWIASLCIFLTGCATYRPTTIPGPPHAGFLPGEEQADRPVEGDRVRVTLLDGRKITGRYAGSGEWTITLETEPAGLMEEAPGYEGFEPQESGTRVIPVGEIRTLEIHDGNTGETIALVVVIGAVATLAAVGIAMKDFMDGDMFTAP